MIVSNNKDTSQISKTGKLIDESMDKKQESFLNFNDGIGCEVGSPQSSAPSCDPSYPDVCIAPYPPDLNCGDIGYSNFRVIGSDPHGFDRDNDGIGCES